MRVLKLLGWTRADISSPSRPPLEAPARHRARHPRRDRRGARFPPALPLCATDRATGVLVWRLRLPLVAWAAAPGLAAAPDVYFNTSKNAGGGLLPDSYRQRGAL